MDAETAQVVDRDEGRQSLHILKNRLHILQILENQVAGLIRQVQGALRVTGLDKAKPGWCDDGESPKEARRPKGASSSRESSREGQG